MLEMRSVAAFLVLVPAAFSRGDGALVGSGGGGLEWDLPPEETCVTPEERAEADRQVRDWFLRNPPAGARAPLPGLEYTFYPMGGRLYRDIFTNNFNDLDPTGGILDWDCGDRTYDGHDATDTGLRSFGEQAIGVPIFAALDGTVIAAHDGEPDMNTSCMGTANSVIIDHGGGRVGYYWHMKTGSVAVSPGQVVVAGEQIGLVASSGCSTGPHLHFASYQNGAQLEPYTGPCNPGASGWTSQTPITYSLYMDEFALSDTPIGALTPPSVLPRSSHWAQTNTTIYLWCFLKGLPASSTWQVRFQRPDGTIAFNSGNVGFGNPYYRASWWWWAYDIPDMKTVAGTWHVRLRVNGIVLIDAPLEVVPAPIPGFNRAPESIAASFVPACPVPSDVLFCEVDTPLAFDDLDWDILSYHYEWKVNGVGVRDVTSAAHSDALPRDSWLPGDVVTCDVTPGDGLLDGPTASARFPDVAAYCTAGTTASGCQAHVAASGVPSLSATSGFDVSVDTVEGNKDGILFFSTNGQQASPWGNGTSYQCVVAPVKRTGTLAGTGSTGVCDGSFQLDFNAWMAANPTKAPAAGQKACMQCWFRDPLNTSNQTTSLSDALAFQVCPR